MIFDVPDQPAWSKRLLTQLVLATRDDPVLFVSSKIDERTDAFEYTIFAITALALVDSHASAVRPEDDIATTVRVRPRSTISSVELESGQGPYAEEFGGNTWPGRIQVSVIADGETVGLPFRAGRSPGLLSILPSLLDDARGRTVTG